MGEVTLEIGGQGAGPPLVFLHAGFPSGRLAPSEPVLTLLAETFRVISPTHPGFGRQDAPRWMTTVDDLAYFYLDLLDTLGLREVVLVGASLGAWIAAEMAVKSTDRLINVVLLNPVGIKVSDRETRDIVDIFSVDERELAELAFADPKRMVDRSSLSDDDLYLMARAREATARYGWSPYLHDPKLLGRLHRIAVPTLVLRGSADRITAGPYGEAFAAAIPEAGFETLPGAGHFPDLETPVAVAQRIVAFVRSHGPSAL